MPINTPTEASKRQEAKRLPGSDNLIEYLSGGNRDQPKHTPPSMMMEAELTKLDSSLAR